MSASKMVFQSVSSGRGCSEFGPHHMVYTDVVHASGRVESTVRGTCDGEYVNAKSSKEWGALDLEVVKSARLSSGWTLVG